MSQDQPSYGKAAWVGLYVGQSGVSRDLQDGLTRLMESQIWHQLAGSVEGRFRKGTMASVHLDARHFSFSLYTTGAFQAATLVLELRGRV